MMRIGHGYDVHRLVPGRKLILGGVDIPHETGLLGHSDADVLTHAVMDALLGSASSSSSSCSARRLWGTSATFSRTMTRLMPARTV